MGQNLISCDRGQSFLLPPSLTDWLAGDHLVRTVLGAVEQMNLDAFYGAYRANGQGRAAYDPQMMVGLLLYSYSVGLRSSRQIERACGGDVAFKVITAMQVPDHSTVAEFRRRHETAIGELFTSVLALCGEVGLVRVGEIAVDGTRMGADASRDCNRGYESIVTEILHEAERVDREEDERYGEARGDELPEQLRTREGRRAALKAAREKHERERAAAVVAGEEVIEKVDLVLDRDQFEVRPRGVARGCVRPVASSRLGGRRNRGRCLARVKRGWWRPSAGWMKSSRSSTPPTSTTSTTELRPATGSVGSWRATTGLTRMRRRWCRRARST